ncbi:MAG: helix-turn-helix transcriptional regulator [Eubacterium sp.]|nr:helix-turn-helix transcriptional regulator [Eubacterium sp.]
MFKNKANDGKNNISGMHIAEYRMAMPEKTSQRALAYMMQLKGIDLDKNAIQRIETGQRFVTDIELKAFAELFNVTSDDLLV